MDQGCAYTSEIVAEINLHLSIFVKAYKVGMHLPCPLSTYFLFFYQFPAGGSITCHVATQVVPITKLRKKIKNMY